MANQYGIDMASIYSNVENIKGQRMQNAARQQGLDKYEQDREREGSIEALKMQALNGNPEALNILASQDSAGASQISNILSTRKAEDQGEQDQIAADNKGKQLNIFRRHVVSGAEGAEADLIAIDPENGPKFVESIGKMNDRKKAAVKASVEEIGQISAYVLGATDEKEAQRRWSMAMNGLSPEAKKNAPKTYNQNWLKLQMAKAQTMTQILEGQKTKAIEEEKPFIPKSADESLIYRQSVELLGGMMDADGNISALDPTIRPKVQAIAVEATKIYTAGKGSITRSDSVSQAASKFGVTMPQSGAGTPPPVQQGSNDPANIMQFMQNQ